MRTVAVVIVVLAALSACGDGDEGGAPPDVIAARQDAARMACVATELLRASEDDIQTMEAALPAPGTVQHIAASAALEFARAYHQHAELRIGAYALLDSALNLSRGEADSLRYLQSAQRFTLTPPHPESLEMNVLREYERDFAALLADPDHRCNWDFPNVKS